MVVLLAVNTGFGRGGLAWRYLEKPQTNFIFSPIQNSGWALLAFREQPTNSIRICWVILHPEALLNFLTIAMAMLAKFAAPQGKASTQK
ncbi:hypothetical protein M23134_07063 [Microscilla marina ATCC 23134]|uniref:Uncharacterized protein n=1 Tax=Microscilla marina ATCC 23134 TaxID=313606 RepID=A1ZT78_MICM2|nr:hypothetical protein M23134_07063 [Microscilla marina ATCC 23134]